MVGPLGKITRGQQGRITPKKEEAYNLRVSRAK